MINKDSDKLKDFKLGTVHGNLFALIADKFPMASLREIIESHSVISDFDIKVRVSYTNKSVGYFISYPREISDEINLALDKIFEKFEPTPDYPNIYSINGTNDYPHISNQIPGHLVVWFKVSN